MKGQALSGLPFWLFYEQVWKWRAPQGADPAAGIRMGQSPSFLSSALIPDISGDDPF